MATETPTTTETPADIAGLERDLLANHGWGEVLNNSIPSSRPDDEVFERWATENSAILAKIEALDLSAPGAIRLKALAITTIFGSDPDVLGQDATTDVRLARQIIQAVAMGDGRQFVAGVG